VIVQLCQNEEEGREKCADYIPEEPTLYGNVTVSVKTPSHVTVANPSVHRTVLEASLPNGQSVEVVHLLYDGWPDRDVPLSPASFRQLRDTVYKLAVSRKCTVLIHCSAGIGQCRLKFFHKDFLIFQRLYR
jgi:protein tyrosine phosphatase